jgi:hypothetical protein
MEAIERAAHEQGETIAGYYKNLAKKDIGWGKSRKKEVK